MKSVDGVYSRPNILSLAVSSPKHHARALAGINGSPAESITPNPSAPRSSLLPEKDELDRDGVAILENAAWKNELITAALQGHGTLRRADGRVTGHDANQAGFGRRHPVNMRCMNISES